MNQIKEVINQLESGEKIKLIKDLEKAIWSDRFRQFLTKIDQRIKEMPISEKEVTAEVERVRKERYVRSCN
jgi:hypothetical protein